MSPPCPILLNDRAGAFRAQVGHEHLGAMAKEVGLEVEVVATASPEEMVSHLRRLVAGGAPRVAVAGGDGTVALAVQELAHSDTVLGILPMGTANNFATALHLPQDLSSALRVLKDGRVLEVDLGKAEADETAPHAASASEAPPPSVQASRRYFTEAAGVGLFADTLALYGRGTNKNFLRGVYAFVRVLFSFRARRVRLVVDGEPLVERAVMCTVANTYRIATAVPIAPGAKVTDGELDVVIIGDLGLGELLPYYRAVRAQVHLSLPKVTALRAREVRVESRQRLNLHCDDLVLRMTPVLIKAEPRALKVLVERL